MARLIHIVFVWFLSFFATASADSKFILGGPESGFGDFLGNLSDEAPQNSSSLTWQVSTVHNVSWIVTSNSSVDLLLVDRLTDGTWNNRTILSNFTGNSTMWNVTVDQVPTNNSSPPVNPFTYFFLLREADDGPVLIYSQNITLIAGNVTVVGPPAKVTVTATLSSTPQGAVSDGVPSGQMMGGGKSHLSTGAIIGIALATTLVAALAVLALTHFLCAAGRRKQQDKPFFVIQKPKSLSTLDSQQSNLPKPAPTLAPALPG